MAMLELSRRARESEAGKAAEKGTSGWSGEEEDAGVHGSRVTELKSSNVGQTRVLLIETSIKLASLIT